MPRENTGNDRSTLRPGRPGDQAPAGTPGTGEAICPQCRGTGRIGGKQCPACEGSGEIIQGIGGG